MKFDKYAIVIGGAHFNSLGIIRALGEAGIKSVFLNSDEWSFSQESKYTIETVNVKCEKEIILVIQEIVKKYGGCPAIYPTSDQSAKILDDNFENLKENTFCPNCKGKMDYYLRKDIMCAVAKEAGFVVPETKLLEINKNFKAELESFSIPFILKPVSNFCGTKGDIAICKSREEIDGIVENFASYKTVLVQQYVHGKENLMIEYCGCKTQGKKAEVYGQLEKIREYPVNRGSTSYAVIKEKITYIDASVLDRMLDMTEFSGIFDLELKVVDGVPYFIEINFRNGAPAYAFIRGGFNLHNIWYAQQNGENIEPSTIKETKLICEGIDLSNVFERNIKITEWIKDYFGADAHMIANKKDIKPFLSQYKLLKPFFEAKFSI